MSDEPPRTMHVPVNAPLVLPAAQQAVIRTMEDGWISSAGPVLERFETSFAALLGARHAVAVSSGTTALHLALAALGIGPGDEVLVPDFTMFSTVAAVLYTGARPVLVDCDPDTFCIDPDLLASAITPRTRAILPVHLFGHSADMATIQAFAMRHGLAVVEDAAQAIGATCRGRPCGAIGTLGCFSFYGNKLVTTGEGGMVVTSDASVATRLRSLRDMAHTPGRRFHHEALGFSYRMSSLQAAFGLGQLDHLDELLGRKRAMAAAYDRRLAGIPGLRLPICRPWAGHAHWMYTVLLDDGCVEVPLPSRATVRERLLARGVDTRDFFESSAGQPALRERAGIQGPFPRSERIARQGFYLPSGLAITGEQIDHVCDALIDALG